MDKQVFSSHVFHRHLKADYPTAVTGRGVWLEDADGKRYLDASGGAAVSCLGHGHPRVVAAIQRQAAELAFAHTLFFTNRPAEDLAERLIETAPDGMGRVYFTSGGSEANEAAMKLARQVMVERGQPQRRHFIAREQSYHGNTLGVLALGGNPGRKRAYGPILADNVSHIPPAYAYRHAETGESEADYARRAAGYLEAEIKRVGSDKVIAFFAETVVGATLGCVPPPTGYFREIRAICDKYGVLLVLDEVMSGMGRTGYAFACLEDGVVPDIITCAKGLGGGMQPIGATLVRTDLVEAIESGSGFFQHGHTYIGHATACAAALEVQNVVRDDKLLDGVKARGRTLRAALDETFGQHPHIGDIRGRGLFRGLELVEDRTSKAPFAPTKGLAAKIRLAAMDHGLICYPGSGTADGTAGDHILLAPPFIASDDDIAEIVTRLAATLETVLGT
jgi:adenosylmethionine-8-amino-7-oxononanoate aminotransferase